MSRAQQGGGVASRPGNVWITTWRGAGGSMCMRMRSLLCWEDFDKWVDFNSCDWASRYLWARRDGGEIQRGRWREGGGGGLSHHRVVACKERGLWTTTYLSHAEGENVPRSADCGEKDGGSLNCGGVGDCRIRGLNCCFFFQKIRRCKFFEKLSTLL